MMATEQVPETSSARILVGIDGSSASLDALNWAARQASLTEATLEVVMTWDWPMTYGWAPPFPSDFDPSASVTEVLEAAKVAVYEKYPAVEVSVRVAQGHPAPILVEASKGANLLVVGSRGHGEFVGMVIGSVSEYCAAHAFCPVLVHRSAT
jgi:nucleotide-binding universal stress UspA family protein